MSEQKRVIATSVRSDRDYGPFSGVLITLAPEDAARQLPRLDRLAQLQKEDSEIYSLRASESHVTFAPIEDPEDYVDDLDLGEARQMDLEVAIADGVAVDITDIEQLLLDHLDASGFDRLQFAWVVISDGAIHFELTSHAGYTYETGGISRGMLEQIAGRASMTGRV